MVNQFAPVGLGHAVVYFGNKESLALQHVSNRVLYQLLGIFAASVRQLLKP